MKKINIYKFIYERLDIIIKILFIESYINNKNYFFYKNLYLKHIKLRTLYIEDNKKNKEDFFNGFIDLINSIKNYGYDKNYPVEINNEGQLVGGAHRLACCIFFGIEPEIKIVDKKYLSWNYEWFKEKKFYAKGKINYSKKNSRIILMKINYILFKI